MGNYDDNIHGDDSLNQENGNNENYSEDNVHERQTNYSDANTNSESNWNAANTNGYQQQNGCYQEERKPKKHLAAKILIPVAIVAALGCSTFFAVNSIKKYTQVMASKKAGEALVERETDSGSAQAEELTGGAEEKAEATLIKSSSDIGTTSTAAKTICLDVSEVVENVMPSVVAITDNLEYTRSNTYNPYNFYFGGGSAPKTEETTSSGSGVIIGQNDQELLIVTNDHVVDNSGNYNSYTISSKGLNVQFSDGSVAAAVIKGTDSSADLAVIAVKLSDITDETKAAIKVAVIGDSDEIKVGSGVIAIGNALGYGQSVTTGIISAKEREVTIDNITRTLLQTDAAINPGNSGGGLFNANGELIGINSAKTSDTSVEGMGFAIPITSAEGIIEDLMNQKTIAEEDQGYLGVTGESVTSTYVTNYGYPEGVSITRISAESPAEKAGLQIYDIVTAVNGKTVKDMNEMKKEVNRHAAGETVTLTVSRPDGRSFKEITVDVTLVRYEDISDGFNTKNPDADIRDEKDEDPEDDTEREPDVEDENENRPNGDMDSLFDWFFNNFN